MNLDILFEEIRLILKFIMLIFLPVDELQLVYNQSGGKDQLICARVDEEDVNPRSYPHGELQLILYYTSLSDWLA